MYCLSNDGLRAVETKGLVRYYRDGEFKFNTNGEEMHCIFTDTGYFMDAFKNEEDARAKLREAMEAAATGLEMFEF
jgi:hypothetical protein